jgi:hypothetical protein
VAFSNHLGAHQNVNFACFPTPNQCAVSASFAGRISVHARNARSGHDYIEHLFDLLSSDTYAGQAGVFACRTKHTSRLGIVTMVTTEAAACQMQGKGDAAIGAAQNVTA